MKMFPRCYSEGTKGKKYSTTTCRNEGWHAGLEPLLPESEINKWDRKRSMVRGKEVPWYYLVSRRLMPGELFVDVRGKELVIA